MSKLNNLVLKFPRTVIALSLLITVIMLTFVPSIQFEPDVKKMIPDDFPAVKNLAVLDSIFGGSEIIVVAVESDSIFTPAGLKKFASLEALLTDIEGVERVMSLTRTSATAASRSGSCWNRQFATRARVSQFRRALAWTSRPRVAR